ncbi:MAG: hypothetical protein ACPHF4_06435, partial [Rubripirellula sp.]
CRAEESDNTHFAHARVSQLAARTAIRNRARRFFVQSNAELDYLPRRSPLCIRLHVPGTADASGVAGINPEV